MFQLAKIRFALLLLLAFCLVATHVVATSLPYAKAGLTDREAAAHLLNRFTFGPRPGQIDRVIEIGLDNWFRQQIESENTTTGLDLRLAQLGITNMTTFQVLSRHPSNGSLRSMAIRDGVVPENIVDLEADQLKTKLQEYAKEHRFRSQSLLMQELKGRKILRSVYTDNQLVEVLTDFWFNHFNVSTTHGQARPWIPSYEEVAIRPYVLGRFYDMLEATAKHPAMLFYLDNHQSNAEESATAKAKRKRRRTRKSRLSKTSLGVVKSEENMMSSQAIIPKPNKKRGINENYARELLELHTLGVDGGYTQADVVATARALTGWKVNGKYLNRIKKGKNSDNAINSFTFVKNSHDINPKTVLGQRLSPNRGIADGKQVLDIVAQHPSTAQHIARKLAVRFVTESPTEAYINRLAQIFLSSSGNLRQMIEGIATSPEFWAEAKRYRKTKSPFRFVVSTLRITEAEIKSTRQLSNWIARIGEPLYACQPPTGYADTGGYWINSGSVLNRANFGMDLFTGKIRGVRVKLAEDSPKQSLSERIQLLCLSLFPIRDTEKMWRQIGQILLASSPELKPGRKQTKARRQQTAQIVGLIIGSPQFQVY